MTAPNNDKDQDNKPDKVPFYIMGAIVLLVIGIVIYGP